MSSARFSGEPSPEARAALARVGLEPLPWIEAYKPGIDRTLLRQNLRRSVDERLRIVQELNDFAARARAATGKDRLR